MKILHKFTILPLSLMLSFLISCEQDTIVPQEETVENSTVISTKTYENQTNWAYYASEISDANPEVDCFFISPTVYSAGSGPLLMSLENAPVKQEFLATVTAHKGLYEEKTRFFSPYYSQVAIEVYYMPEEEREIYLNQAYEAVREAFLYYYEVENQGRPFILAGFSQGADMCLRLLKEFNQLNFDQMVACYAIGWGVTEAEIEAFPQLKMAESSNDLGVIISYNTEAEGVETSVMVPEKTLSINPLSWNISSDYAPKTLNLGACYTDFNGNVVAEFPEFTGAYICPDRGTLIVDEHITAQDFPAGPSLFQPGVFHLYDTTFFYRNLQENVQERIETFLK